MPTAEVDASRLAKKQRDKPRIGREVRTIELAPEGEKLIGKVLPRQEGMVRSLMGGLDSREMRTLIRICEKLRLDDDVTRVAFGTALIQAGEDFEREERDGRS